MKQELISIIVPVYKVEKYLEKCIDSIVRQNYSNIEVILVDDGSPDNCGEICESWMKKDNRIRVFHKKNGGLSDARNCGIEHSKGEYITFVDSDDYISEDYIMKLYYFLVENNADISVCNTDIVFEDSNANEVKDANIMIKRYDPDSAFENMLYEIDLTNSAWGKLYKRKLWNGIRFPVNKLYEDMFVTYKLFYKAKNIIYVSEKLYHYLVRSDSILGTVSVDEQMDMYSAAVEMLNYASKINHNLTKAAQCRLCNSCIEMAMRCKKGESLPKFVWEKIRRYRCKVIFNKKIKKKYRILACVSFVGARNLRNIYQKFRKR